MECSRRPGRRSAADSAAPAGRAKPNSATCLSVWHAPMQCIHAALACRLYLRSAAKSAVVHDSMSWCSTGTAGASSEPNTPANQGAAGQAGLHAGAAEVQWQAAWCGSRVCRWWR